MAEAAEGLLLVDVQAAALLLAWLAAAVDTRLRAAVMVGCRTSLRLAVISREGAIVVADSSALPVQQEDNAAVYNVIFLFFFGFQMTMKS